MSVINTNTLSLGSQNTLRRSQAALGSAIERLSSGLRINNARDDAAGQAIANRMTAQIRGMTQAARNANDGISLVQTAEGSLKEINTNLQRIRELAVQAANDTNNSDDRASILTEIDQRLYEIVRIANSTSFNGKGLLGYPGAPGQYSEFNFQVGAGTDISKDVITVGKDALIDAQFTTELWFWYSDSAAGGIAVGSTAGAQEFIGKVDSVLATVDTARSKLGALQNRFESVINNLNTSINNLSASRSRIEDADYAMEVSNMTRAQILQQAGTSVLAQANQVPQTVLSLLRG